MMELLQNTQYEVLTSNGFENFLGLKRVTQTSWYRIGFEDCSTITCTPDHIFFINGVECSAKDLREGDVLDGENKQSKLVIRTEDCDTEKDFYDLVEVESHKYYANGVEIHNCDCDFASSGNTVVDPALLQWYIQTTTQEPAEKRGADQSFWIWEQPSPTKSYIVSADVARGDGADYSAFHIIDIETLTQVGEYKGQLTTKDFGNLLVSVATEWNDALLVIENNNIGWATIQQVIDRSYKNLYYSYKSDVLDTDVFLHKGYDLANKTDMVAGFTMSHKTRPLAISKFDLLTREKSLIFRSRRFLDELSTFVWKDGKAQAANGYNDDLVMCMCQGIWVRDTALRLRQAGIDLTKAALGATRNAASIYTNLPQRNESWKHNVNGRDEDLTWLI